MVILSEGGINRRSRRIPLFLRYNYGILRFRAYSVAPLRMTYVILYAQTRYQKVLCLLSFAKRTVEDACPYNIVI